MFSHSHLLAYIAVWLLHGLVTSSPSHFRCFLTLPSPSPWPLLPPHPLTSSSPHPLTSLLFHLLNFSPPHLTLSPPPFSHPLTSALPPPHPLTSLSRHPHIITLSPPRPLTLCTCVQGCERGSLPRVHWVSGEAGEASRKLPEWLCPDCLRYVQGELTDRF